MRLQVLAGELERVLVNFPIRIQAGRLINPTRVKYFSAKNYSADFSETRGIDWNLFRASNDIPRICGSDGNIPN